MKEKMKKIWEEVKVLWNKVDGKKTYISAFLLLILTGINTISPEAIPEEFYDTLKSILELLLYGSATHGIYKTIKKK